MDEHKLWRRSREEQYNNMGVIILENSFKPCFSQLEANTFVDTRTKEAALTVSPSVVSLISYHGLEEIGWACGIVLESNMANDIFFNTILTSASLLRPNGSESFCRKELKVEVILPDGSICGGDIFSFDFHYNICVITVRSDSLLPTIKLRCVDDTIETTTDAKERSVQLRAHSNLLKLFPGDKFIALGRYHKKPYDLMVAPGKYSIDRCGFDCKELLRVNCKLQKNREYNRPLLGMQVNTLYSAEVAELEIIMRKFPDGLKGIIVEEVTPGSPAAAAGICPNDVIVECGGEDVESCLQLFEISWDKVGKRVGLGVRRASTGEAINLNMVVGSVDDATQFNRWPHPSEREVFAALG